MASSLALPNIQTPLLCGSSNFLGKSLRTHLTPIPSIPPLGKPYLKPSAMFKLWELMGGRGLCNGEEGLLKELKKQPIAENPPQSQQQVSPSPPPPPPSLSSFDIGEDAFEKELSGLTGGFPGGEKGLERFIEKNPPPPKTSGASEQGIGSVESKPKRPELPLLMPGMIVIVKNSSNPFHMYCGIVQRITDGKAGVLFEGGNWDKLITFRLDELERREKGPPMVNPKSAILETLGEQ